MTLVVSTQKRYRLLRAKAGVQELGTAWPAGATFAPKRDRYALIHSNGFRVMKDARLEDAIQEAQALVLCGGQDRCSVSVVSGSFGQSNVYEEVMGFRKSDAEPTTADADADVKFMFGGIAPAAKLGQSTGDALRISGMASAATLDRDFDIIEAGAFTENIQPYLDNPVLLWMHDHTMPMGVVEDVTPELEGDLKGLSFVARVEDDAGKQWIDKGMVRMVSVGFLIKDRKFVEPTFNEDGEVLTPGVRVITRAELVEISLVTVPSNREARFDVVKSVKAYAPGADFGTCSPDAESCVCDLPEKVNEYRPLPVAAVDASFSADQSTIRKAYGEDALRHCHAAESAPGRYVLQTAGLVGGELRTVPALVRLAMAEVVARSHDMTDDQRSMCWSHIGRRWMDCFPDEPIPAIDKHTSPGHFRKALEGGGVVCAGAIVPTGIEPTWSVQHGFEVDTEATSDNGTHHTYDRKSLAGSRSFVLADGVRVLLSIPSAEDKTVKTAAYQEDPPAEPEAAPPAEPESDHPPEPSTATPPDDSDASEQPADGDASAGDDTAEVSVATLDTIDRALNGKPVTQDELEAAIAEGADVFGETLSEV